MKNQTVVMALAYVVEEIFGRNRGLLGIELDANVALTRSHQYHRILFRHFFTSQKIGVRLSPFSQKRYRGGNIDSVAIWIRAIGDNSHFRKEDLCQAIKKSKVF